MNIYHRKWENKEMYEKESKKSPLLPLSNNYYQYFHPVSLPYAYVETKIEHQNMWISHRISSKHKFI